MIIKSYNQIIVIRTQSLFVDKTNYSNICYSIPFLHFHLFLCTHWAKISIGRRRRYNEMTSLLFIKWVGVAADVMRRKNISGFHCQGRVGSHIVKSWHEFMLEGKAEENRQSAKIFTISSKCFLFSFWHWMNNYGEIWLINFICNFHNFRNFINWGYIFLFRYLKMKNFLNTNRIQWISKKKENVLSLIKIL